LKLDETQIVFQIRESNHKKKPYDKNNLKRAFDATLGGMSVYRASRVYNVPESTLRDRTRQNVDINCKHGAETLFTCEEERKLADHIVFMANIGYGYSVTDVRCMAADYARSLGKNVRAKGELSSDWFYGYMQRWAQLKAVKPQKLGLQRAKTASKATIDRYFEELGSILHRNGLLDAPERIWNVDETGFSTEHSPPKIVCAKDAKAQAVTSPRSKNVTMVGGINALGNHAPPFYIFPGKRWQDCFIEGAVAGSVGKMSDSGWINRGIFEEYVTSHLARYAALNVNLDDKPVTLVLYDGHKSHLSLTLTTWASERNIILFVLPPHSSHLTQPLDIGVFGPLKVFYNRECRAFMHANPGMSITTRDIARLTAKPFTKAFCTENITSAFRKSGIYPFNANAITDVQTAPSSIYPNAHIEESDPVSEVVAAPRIESDPVSEVVAAPRTEGDPVSEVVAAPRTESDTATLFLNSRTIKQVVQRPKKKFIPPVKIVGNLQTEANTISLRQQQLKRDSKVQKVVETHRAKQQQQEQQPSTSGIPAKPGRPLTLVDYE